MRQGKSVEENGWAEGGGKGNWGRQLDSETKNVVVENFTADNAAEKKQQQQQPR